MGRTECNSILAWGHALCAETGTKWAATGHESTLPLFGASLDKRQFDYSSRLQVPTPHKVKGVVKWVKRNVLWLVSTTQGMIHC